MTQEYPAPQNQPPSLYVSREEHDACGIGMLAQLGGQASHELVRQAISMLECMEHRGARGYDPSVGDGAGILIRIPDLFFRKWADREGHFLPPAGEYAVGVLALSPERLEYHVQETILRQILADRGLQLLALRPVPVQPTQIGEAAQRFAPRYVHAIVHDPHPNFEDPALRQEDFERQLYVLRNALERAWDEQKDFGSIQPHIVSCSSRTMVYKGQLGTDQLLQYFSDLQDPMLTSPLALVHSRFSTNTFPSWSLAQPFRYIAHNGEINTIRANVIWMQAREAVLRSRLFSREELDLLLPICDPDASDSRNLDRAVELLLMSGRPIEQVMAMLMPMAWESDQTLPEAVQAFYAFHSLLIEPWDGPASVCFTDGRKVGACLDRNGLRPSRYTLTHDGLLVLGSETGAVPIAEDRVKERGRLGPGNIILIDLDKGEFLRDTEVKHKLASAHPYAKWIRESRRSWEELPLAERPAIPGEQELHLRNLLFGVTREQIQTILAPMAGKGKEPIGSMGADTPLAILSDRPQHMSHYFKQLFAQVSNPPIDPIREAAVMSLRTWLGPGKNLLEEVQLQASHLPMAYPILTPTQLARLEAWGDPNYHSARIDAVIRPGENLRDALARINQSAERAAKADVQVLIITDRKASEELLPMPMLLALGSIHHHLIRQGIRPKLDLLVDTADAMEVHHIATLIAYGATAVCPYHTLDMLSTWAGQHLDFRGQTEAELHATYLQAVNAGLKKIMSKMGISCIQSYHGAQLFEIVGFAPEVVEACFTGTISRLGGLDFAGIEQEIRERHAQALASREEDILPSAGTYQWRVEGERHAWDPKTIHLLQKSSRLNNFELYKQYAERVNDGSTQPLSVRHLFELNPSARSVPLDEVESVESILKRFATGAMSFGSISHEAHSTLAIAMNRIGGKSNSGEGGEDVQRFSRKENGDWERSAIKQIASGRFGVTSHYLSEAEELQIKIAQGAKPGEGGQLPGHKVDAWIGRVRHSTPGVGLISPPPHHDIYSIEDLAQLIYDLHHANPLARVSVKLVAKAGVGTIAAGVAKGGADHILISGYDGGTGASPLSSIRHAGLPWELGLAEAHQTLVKNRLRERVTLQADGGMRTGRDLAIATLLGAEEWAVATAALVVEGCILMRKCHLNTCPVGVATQDPVLRKRFSGTPEQLINFFTFMAQDLREHMAMLGYRRVEDMVGQAQHLRVRQLPSHQKAGSLDLGPLLSSFPLRHNEPKPGFAFSELEQSLIQEALPALSGQQPVVIHREVTNVHRSIGTMLSYEITRRRQAEGYPEGHITLRLRGAAGQSFGAFAARGLQLCLAGQANDYLGKGLSGATILVHPDRIPDQGRPSEVIVGNVALYGATSGEAYLAGQAGERFAVRNSGATAVVEGIGDHGCEYMTGGKVAILGSVGKNFAAGMSGGVAYVYDPEQQLPSRLGSMEVDLDPLSEADREALLEMLQRHHELSASPLAHRILQFWPESARLFTKVIPQEYKRILETRGQPQPSTESRMIG